MARPLKQGLDYFPLDVDIDQDDKIQLVEARHGISGFAIFIKLLEKIYKEGYYYSWMEKEQLLFSKRINVDINLLNCVVNDCIKYGLFNSSLYGQYKILTSHGIQKRYFEASTRRKRVEVDVKYLLINVENYNNVNNNFVNDSKNTTLSVVSEDISTQRKGNEKERKVNYAEFVKLTDTEYRKLVEKYTETVVKEMIQILDNYKGSQGKEYNSDYRAILSWVVKRYDEDLAKQMLPGQTVTPFYKPIVIDDSRGED